MVVNSREVVTSRGSVQSEDEDRAPQLGYQLDGSRPVGCSHGKHHQSQMSSDGYLKKQLGFKTFQYFHTAHIYRQPAYFTKVIIAIHSKTWIKCIFRAISGVGDSLLAPYAFGRVQSPRWLQLYILGIKTRGLYFVKRRSRSGPPNIKLHKIVGLKQKKIGDAKRVRKMKY